LFLHKYPIFSAGVMQENGPIVEDIHILVSYLFSLDNLLLK
jgi:hypothetical protein